MFGFSDREFYALTPRQYSLLLEQHRERQKHFEWLTGVLASTIANWSMGGPKEALQPKDFPLPLLHMAEKKRRAPRVNRHRVADSIRSAFENAMKRMG